MAGMDVSVDETGYHETLGGIDGRIDIPRKRLPDKKDRIFFENQLRIAQ